MKFTDLGLAEPILRAVAAEGYTVPTPIQAQAIPHALAGRDMFGCAQTGTGKTAAFALPILQRLSTSNTSKHPSPRCLILAPTRELASQIGECFAAYGRNTRLKHVVIFGGVNQFPQVKSLRKGVDIIIATPGRLLDLMDQGHVDLRAVEVFVLDEADRMLDMGFIHDIRTIVKHVPAKRQTLLFSATMPHEIRTLASSILREPVSVQVNPPASTVKAIEQSVYHIEANRKPALLAHLLKARCDQGKLNMQRTLVFTRTKRGADRVVKHLMKAGLRAEAIHSNKSQNARMKALTSFRSTQPPVLVATDIASRGIDVDGISHVINYDLPHEPESYVHRIGRTARAGAQGVAIAFCDPAERDNLRAIERLTRTPIKVERAMTDVQLLDRNPLPPIAETRNNRGDSRSPSGNHRSGRGKNFNKKRSAAPNSHVPHSKPAKRHHSHPIAGAASPAKSEKRKSFRWS